MLRVLELESVITCEETTNKLIVFLSHARNFIDSDKRGYVIKRVLTGISNYKCGECHSKTLEIKEIKSPADNEKDTHFLSCTYHFCPDCGTNFYDDGHNSQIDFSNF